MINVQCYPAFLSNRRMINAAPCEFSFASEEELTAWINEHGSQYQDIGIWGLNIPEFDQIQD